MRRRPAHAEVSERQRGTARQLRRNMTEAERLLWHALKGHRFAGFGFRRQAPMGDHIVDFVCHGARLVIEVDGAQHGFDRHLSRDSVRDAWLHSRGYRVLRFWNGEVLHERDMVMDTIFAALIPNAAPRELSEVTR